MAMMNCPECQKEISDTNNRCPFCGYVLKKDAKSKRILIVVIVLVAILAVAAAVYALVIRPNQLLQQAEKLIARGKYAEADVILTEVPDSKRKNALVAQIVLYEAQSALEAEDYALAEKKIALLPANAAIDPDTLYKINMQLATAILGQGRYIEADALYEKLAQSEEVKLTREKFFYESRVLYCCNKLQDVLIFPESLVLEEVLLADDDTLDEEQSTDEKKVYVYEEPIVLLHYRVKSRGGSMTDGFVRFLWKENDYEMQKILDSLETDDRNLENMDADERREYGKETWERANIQYDLVAKVWFETYDMGRLNAVIKNGFTDNVQMIQRNEIVPQPTPRIVMVTPKPE